MNHLKISFLLVAFFLNSCTSQKTAPFEKNTIKTVPSITNTQRIHDIWNAVRINGAPINRMVAVPRLELNTTTMGVIGTDGCNNYTGIISKLSEEKLSFSKIVATQKMCLGKNVAAAYTSAINQVATYKIDGLQLILYNKSGHEVLAFLKGD